MQTTGRLRLISHTRSAFLHRVALFMLMAATVGGIQVAAQSSQFAVKYAPWDESGYMEVEFESAVASNIGGLVTVSGAIKGGYWDMTECLFWCWDYAYRGYGVGVRFYAKTSWYQFKFFHPFIGSVSHGR